MKKQLNTAIAALFLTTASMTVTAADDNWYGYVGMQNSELDVNTSSLENAGLTVDKKDTGFNFGAGYKMDNNFSFEMGYMDMGKAAIGTGTIAATASGSGNIGGNSYSYTSTLAGTVDATVKSDGYTLSGIYSVPMADKFDGFLKAGIYFWDAEAKLTGTITAGTLTINDTAYTSGTHDITGLSKTGSDLYVGLGGSYELSSDLDLRVDYTQYKVWGEDVNVTGMTLVSKF
jgi:hypothetical protein